MQLHGGIRFATNCSGHFPTNKYYSAVPQMEDDSFSYTCCQISLDSADGTVWIVYSAVDFGKDGAGTGQSFVIYPKDSGRWIDVGFPIKSAQGFDVNTPTMAIFEHSQYRGTMLSTRMNISNLKPYFPPGAAPGVSSVIATSGLWRLYSKTGFNGSYCEVDAKHKTQEIRNFADIGFNDRAQSLEVISH